MKVTVLRNYARLIARKGVNIQKDQDVLIYCGFDQPKFIELLVDECYKAGARKVIVEFDYQKLYKLDVKYQSVDTLGTVEKWKKERLKHWIDTQPCRIYIESDDPDGLKGIDQDKIAKADQKSWPIVKPYWDKMENKYQWCIAAVPGAAWAKKVFPDLPKGKAMEKLWEAILFTSRAMEDPIAAWEAHNKDLHDRCEYLNNLGIAKLHYKGDNGTDLTVGMIPEGMFLGGEETTIGGIPFDANIPSEECYTSPMCGEAEGIVYATKPLSYNGELIEDFWVRFEKGKAVEVHAEKNQALLEQMISMDKGAAYLGECALVPVNSPISESGLLFWNTLFDENAACHLALGAGFTNTIRGYEEKTIKECRKMGINDSMEHNDFMIGYGGLDIDAITQDGKTVPIFRSGKWAFEV